MGKNKKNKKAKDMATTVAAPAETAEVKDKDNDKAIVDALKKNTKKGKKVAGSKSTSPRVTIDSVTMDMLRRPGGATKAELVSALVKAFPGHAATLEATTKRRISHYLANKFGVKINKSNDGKYTIAA